MTQGYKISIENDAQAAVDINFPDQEGNNVIPAAKGSVAVQDSTIVSAILSDDGTRLLLVPVAGSGGTRVSYNDGASLSFYIDATIIAPSPASAAPDVVDAIFTPKGSQVAGFSSTAPAPEQPSANVAKADANGETVAHPAASAENTVED